MESKITIEENQAIEINEVILTQKVIHSLKTLQENENEVLKRILNDLAETVCFLAIEAFDYQGLDKLAREKKLLGLTVDISYYREWLSDLKKPE